MDDMLDEAEGRARGGHARAAKLSPGQRSDIAKRAAKKRWADVQQAAEYSFPVSSVHG